MEPQKKESHWWVYIVFALLLIATAIVLFVLILRPDLLLPNETRIQRQMRTPITLTRLPKEVKVEGYTLHFQSTGLSLTEVQEKAKRSELLVSEGTQACYGHNEVIPLAYELKDISVLGSIHLYGSLRIQSAALGSDVFGFYLQDRETKKWALVPLVRLTSQNINCRFVTILKVVGASSIPWDEPE